MIAIIIYLLPARNMENFTFSSSSNSQEPKETFYGPQFYTVYKEAEFLRSSENVEMILSKAYELRKKLNEIEPGKLLKIDGMMLERNTPLLVKKTAMGVPIEDYEFSVNRLTGLTAAYVYENRHRFPKIESSEAKALGLTWNSEVMTQCKLYLSAVTGTEHFIDQFSFWPLICALRKLQLKKIPIQLVIKNAKIKNSKGETMARLLMQSKDQAVLIWNQFPNTTPNDLPTMLSTAPPQLRKFFC
ncbi:hypothetical protein K1T71_009156 [Dendrolimus kikuchii]|uniref:Uncharacterized protein n=1 Tax=Dendrolimus kikuchii TaxID=765133 RepID=A0ACC1CU12_9NEOP|nr:hypothetical protein K1T71_009156 [Dendrolimus kikuchii]